jgi:hypothetical protein
MLWSDSDRMLAGWTLHRCLLSKEEMMSTLALPMAFSTSAAATTTKVLRHACRTKMTLRFTVSPVESPPNTSIMSA